MNSDKKTNLRPRLTAAILALLATVSSAAVTADTAANRLKESATILKEIMDAPDQGIPVDLLESVDCVVIVPGVKQAGFVVGGKYGRGFAVCRKDNHAGWGAPAAVRIEGGSFGFQIGASETDVVMLVMDQRSMSGILSSKFNTGGAAEVAAGPVGRSSTAQTDASMRARSSYSRSRGVFARSGADRRNPAAKDPMKTRRCTVSSTSNEQVLNGGLKPPAAAADLLALLNNMERER